MYYNGAPNNGQDFNSPNNLNYEEQNYVNSNPQGYSSSNVNYNGYNNPNLNKGTQPIRGWCWGAFMYNWIWGIAHKCYLPLLCFVPLLNIVWIFVCGAKGHEWAMNSGLFNTVEEYNASMSTWNRAGKFAFFFTLIFFVIYFIFFIGLFGLTFASSLGALSSTY